MAIYENDPFPGTDYSKYSSWKKITLPDGRYFYVIPGHEGYVFDPVASNASGRKVFRANPQLAIEDQKKKEEQLQAQADQAAYVNSPMGQLVPVAGTVGGTVAAAQLMKPGATAFKALKDGSVLMTDGTIKGGNALAQSAANGATGGTAALGSEATAGLDAAGQIPGSATGFGSTGALSTGLGVAGAALGTYEALQGIKNHNALQAGLGGAGIGLGLNAAGLALGPLGWGAALGVPLLGALGGKMFDHKSTKEYQQERWGDLSKAEDAPTQSYAQGYQEYLGSDQAKTDAQDENTFGYKKKNGTLKAEDVWGGYGMFKTFGSDWLGKYSEDERRKISQALIDNDLLGSDKGDIVVTDAERARKVKDDVLSGTTAAPATPAQAAAQGAVQTTAPAGPPIVGPGQRPQNPIYRDQPIELRRAARNVARGV